MVFSQTQFGFIVIVKNKLLTWYIHRKKKNFNLVSPCNTKPLTIYRKEGLKNLLPFFTALCGTPKTELEPQVRPLLPILQFLSKLRFLKITGWSETIFYQLNYYNFNSFNSMGLLFHFELIILKEVQGGKGLFGPL